MTKKTKIIDPNSWTGDWGENEWSLYCGDSHAVLQSLENELFDSVITSPPYYSLRDYGVEGQIGLEDTIGQYIDSLYEVMEDVYRVLKPTGLLFLNIGDTYYSGKGKSHGTDPKSKKRRFGLRPVDKSGGLDVNAKPKSLLGIPWRLALKMAENGWVLRSSIVWHRKSCLPESVQDRPRRTYEFIFMFSKNRKYFFNKEALIEAQEEDLWTISERPKNAKGLQTAPFPDELVKRCTQIGCPEGGSVLDPFVGSGTTMRVALELKRNVTGIELNPNFCKHVVKSLRR